jgi:chromosome segregation ATPase
MRPLTTRIAFELVLGAVVVASLLIILRKSRRLAEFEIEQAANNQSLRLLLEALRQKGYNAGPWEVTEQTSTANDHGGITKREAVIARLDHELAEDRSTIADLQKQLSSSNDQNSKAQATADEQLRKLQADSQAHIQDLQTKLDTALAQLDIVHQRVASLEADNNQLRAETSGVTSRAAEVSHIVAGLQDLERRRDVYLTSILRRYRDITDEFRGMSSILDTSHEPGSNACSGAALSRIQNAVNSAEDDLRQTNELNARSQKLEKQLLKN